MQKLRKCFKKGCQVRCHYDSFLKTGAQRQGNTYGTQKEIIAWEMLLQLGEIVREREDILLQIKRTSPRSCSFSRALPPSPYAQSHFPFLSRRTEAKKTGPELAFFALPELDDGTPPVRTTSLLLQYAARRKMRIRRNLPPLAFP